MRNEDFMGVMVGGWGYGGGGVGGGAVDKRAGEVLSSRGLCDRFPT